MFTAILLGVFGPQALAGVAPLLSTEWGQSDAWDDATPVDAQGEQTAPGCTTVAAAQVLYYYQHAATAASDVSYGLDNEVYGDDVFGGYLEADLSERGHDWSAMAETDADSSARIAASAAFIYHVGVTLNAQFGDPTGSPATGKQLENAFRYQWGFDAISRRSMSVIAKDAFLYDDAEWAEVIRGELDAGRPVIYMALQQDGDAGHAFVIDGYRDDGLVHVNWGWGGHGNGYYDPNALVDPSGRSWSREPMIFRGLEPTEGAAAAMMPAQDGEALRWTGNGSLIARASGSATGYGLTLDEASIYAGEGGTPTVFFQWEIDAADGERLQIDADADGLATITYGLWGDRSQDRVYRDVSLPFVLDPARDGYGELDGEYFVIAVSLEGDGVVSAAATGAAGTEATSAAAGPLVVDGYRWSGNASVIGLSSGAATGYGLTHDEAIAHPGEVPPAVFFQWEIDGADGRTLEIGGEGEATIRYGAWSDHRGDDVQRTVSLPATIDPAADGRSDADGEFYVVRVALKRSPPSALTITATAK